MRRAWPIMFGIAIVCAAGLWSAVHIATAQSEAAPPAPSTQPAPDETQARGLALLDRARQRLVEAQAVSVDLEQVVSMNRMPQDAITKYTFAIQQPDKLALVVKDGTMGHTVIMDGENLLTYVPPMQRYFKEPAPASVQALLGGSFGEHEALMAEPLLSLIGPLLFARDAQSMILSDVRYIATERIDDAPVHRIKFTVTPDFGEFDDEPDFDVEDFNGEDDAAPADDQPPDDADVEGDDAEEDEFMGDLDADDLGEEHTDEMSVTFDLWLDEGGHGLPRKMELDLTKALQTMADNDETAEAIKELDYRYMVRFQNWRLNPELPADQFAFAPPAEATQVESLLELMGEFEGDIDEPDPSILIGEPAPNFDLENLEGKSVTLAQHGGRDIVILDFWATWCGPCVRALPEVNKVAMEFADRNVVLYAVNQAEEKDHVRSFLDRKKWTLNVLFDPEGEVGGHYLVSGIPQTVIVDKAGVVQAVHVGYSPDIAARLKREIETLLAGGTLIPGEDDEPDEVDADADSTSGGDGG